MMLPAATSCPPKRLTPRRFDCESRPLRELPPAFLCAMACLSPQHRCLCLRNTGDLDFGVGLTVAPEPFRVLAPAQLENHHFLAEAVSDNLRFHRGAFHHRGSDTERLTVTDEEDLVEHEFAAHGGGELLDPQLLSGGDTILFAAGSDHRVHADLRITLEKHEIIHTFSGCGKKLCYSPDPPFSRSRSPIIPLQPELLRHLIAADMLAVDAMIRRRLESDVVLVRQIAEYIIAGGGKRLRPALVFLAAGATGYRGEHHVELAAVVEFIHTATLLHDDVVDESELRRGRKTANAEFGNAASVLVGDFLYSRAFQIMVAVRSMRVMEVLADATNTIAEGEVLQLLNAHNFSMSEAAYLEVIRRKTAKLFEAAAQLGAILGGAGADIERGLARYGMHLGTAFQLIDDVLDYSGDATHTGKNLGDDLKEGKPTLPLIHVMQRGSPAQASLVRSAIERGGREEFRAVLDAIRLTGALDYARNKAKEEARAASEAIAGLPSSSYRESLLELSVFAVERDY